MSSAIAPHRIVSSVTLRDQSRRRIALTYDDGPSKWTEAFLEVLHGANARATFYVMGQAIDAWEDALAEVARSGHEIGNHLFSHPRPDLISEQELDVEIARTSSRIEAVIGTAPETIRAPYGLGEDRVAPIAARYGMPVTVHWSVAPYDWKEPDSELIVDRVMNEIENGGIVGLHDGMPPIGDDGHPSCVAYTGHPSRVPTLLATARLLTLLSQEGYEFVTVSELLRDE